MTFHPSTMLVTTCLPWAKMAQVSGNLTCADFCEAACARPIPFPTATIMQCKQFPPCKPPVEELDGSKMPPHSGLLVVVHLAPTCHELHQFLKPWVWIVRIMLQPGPRALRFPFRNPDLPLTWVIFPGTFSDRLQRQRLHQTRHLLLILHIFLPCPCGRHRLKRSERGGREGGAVWSPQGTVHAKSTESRPLTMMSHNRSSFRFKMFLSASTTSKILDPWLPLSCSTQSLLSVTSLIFSASSARGQRDMPSAEVFCTPGMCLAA